MEVSTLQVRVTSEGVQQVSRQLGGLGNSADNADTKVTKLTDSITKLIGMQGRLGSVQQAATQHAQNQANVFGNLHLVMGQVATNMAGITAATLALATAMQNVNGQTNNVAGALQRKSHWGNVATSTLKAMATASSVYLGLGLAKNIVESADQWANMSAKLQVVTGSQRNATRAMDDIFDVSQKLRVPLEATTQLWTRMSPAMQRMGRSGEDTTRVVQSVSTALQLSGATTAEASSAMLQLSQSFNAGRLNGAEFNAVAEAAPLILDAIAVKMGKSREELKKLGSDGKITGKVMADALVEIGPKWDEMFGKLPVTFSGAMTVLKNSWFKAIGEMGKETGFNQELVKAVRVVESLIPGIARGLADAFIGMMTWVDANKERLGQIWEQVVGIGKDVWGIVAGVFEWIGKLAGAGDEVSVLASGLFGVRLVMAAIVDLTKFVAASFINVGADIYEFFLMPLSLVVKAIEMITSALAGVARISKAVADLLGNAQAAKIAEDQAKSFESFSQTVEGYYTTAISFGQKARDVADDLTAGFRSGNTEVQKLLDSTAKVATTAARKKEAYDTSAFPGKPGGAPIDEKAAKAAAKELEKYQNAYDSLNNKIKEQIELQARLKTYGLDYDKLSTGTKERIKWETELQNLQRDGGSKQAKDRAFILLLAAKELEAYEQKNERVLENLKLEKAEQDSAKSKLKTLEEEAVALENKVATFGMMKGQVEALELAQAKASAAELAAMEVISPHQVKMLELLNAQISARERIAAGATNLGELEAAERLEKALDSSKAVKFGNDFKEAFGKVGKSIGGVADAFEKMNQRQVKTNKLREDFAKSGLKGAKAEEQMARIQDIESRNAIDSYADMASAAKDFFDEKSKGYAALEAAEKTFRAFQMAMQIKSFLQESGFITALTSIFVGAKATEASAEIASVGTNATANAAKQAANATTAATSALAAPWPASFASFAIVIGLLAALGVGLAGGGSAPSAPSTNIGAGTVLGDDSKASESLQNSIELLEDVDRMTMRYSAQMAASLLNIEASLAGVTNLVLRNASGVTTGDNFGVNQGTVKSSGDVIFNALDGITGSKLGNTINNAVLALDFLGGFKILQSMWGKTSTEIVQAGVMINGALQGLINGVGFSQFADVKTTSSSFFGLKKDTSFSTQMAGLDPELARQFGLVLGQMTDAVVSAAVQLGTPLSTIEQRLSNFVLNLGRIDLKGLTGEQMQERLEAVFGQAGDLIARQVIPGYEAFQKVGEGYLETIVRVASGVEQATYELDKLGVAAINVFDIINKQGDVGTELVRQSLLARELGSGIGEIIAVLTGSASEIASAYKSLTTLRRAMQDVGLGSNLGIDMLRTAGGLEALQDAVESYTENFFSDAERQAMKVQLLTDQFAALGLAMPTTKDAFRGLINSLRAGGQETLATQVLMLADSFADMAEGLASNEEALEAVETARNALNDAYEREKTALEDVRDKFEGFASSLREFKNSLLTGDLSTLNASEKYGVLSSRYESTRAAAMSGDETAIANFAAIAQEFLQFSREFNASGAQYTSDFNSVLAATTALEELTTGRATEAEQQLMLLEQQVDGLLTVNESVLTVAQAIINLQAAMTGVGATSLSAPAEVDIGGRAGQTDTQIPREQALGVVADEVRAMRVQLASLQEQQSNETAALIASNYDANEQNAQAVAAGSVEAASARAYSERVRSNIA